LQGGPDNLLVRVREHGIASAQEAAEIAADQLAASCGLRPPGQRVVRATRERQAEASFEEFHPRDYPNPIRLIRLIRLFFSQVQQRDLGSRKIGSVGGKSGLRSPFRHLNEAFSRPFFSAVRDGFSCRSACGVVVFSTDSPPFGIGRAANFYL